MTAAPRTARKGKRRPPIIVHRRKQAPPLPPLARPLDAVIVALDAAKRTGWAVYVRGVLHAFGDADSRKHDERGQVIAIGLRVAEMLRVPCGMLIETPYGGYTAVVLSLTETKALWREDWTRMTGTPDRCIDRTAGEWRRGLFGRGNMPREQARALELQLAKRIVARDLPGVPLTAIDGDSAAAICIGSTVTHAREWLAVLGCGVVPRAINNERVPAK